MTTMRSAIGRCAALALLAATASALSCSQRRESPALPLDDGANYSLGSPASDWAPGTLPGRYGEALDFSGAVVDAPVPAFAHRTALHRKNATARRRLAGGAATKAEQGLTPLFMGIGTHYAHVYVGTPPQRVSVIVDTGSHHTAFPCSGCKSCGKHTDPYFDPDKSSTLRRLGCSDCVAAARCVTKTCQVSQSYTEGSSWKAVQMKDAYYVGGTSLTEKASRDGSAWIATPFVFGCQTYETGLFRTQKADGIMGMSMHAQTLVPTMRSANALGHNSFSLCFMHGGGTMALGGVDERIHAKPMDFVPLAKNSGWFTVKMLDILVDGKSIGVPASTYATGKGTIVDSGTTDTYLPRRAADQFKRAWSNVMGSSPKYANTKIAYTAAQAAKLPTITFVFEGDVRVDMKADAYMEKAAGKYVPRVYLTEASGAVLGANFMQDHDVFFDAEHRRIGFATANCDYNHQSNRSR
ncbi:aspartic-type endopeptidase [Aureococcus anophagefferens]|uniref:Aspartic-type endopeptidase n=2 Tax=Aureococcus anophagefferens TaxID=44056 RepID=A0ABR1G1T4_AURAN